MTVSRNGPTISGTIGIDSFVKNPLNVLRLMDTTRPYNRIAATMTKNPYWKPTKPRTGKAANVTNCKALPSEAPSFFIGRNRNNDIAKNNTMYAYKTIWLVFR